MVVHYIKPHENDGCRDSSKWPEKERYNQKMAIGCGDVGKSSYISVGHVAHTW